MYLPSTRWFVQGYDPGQDVGYGAGTFVSAGIPNHRHNVQYQLANCQCGKNGGIRSSHTSATKKYKATTSVLQDAATLSSEAFAGSDLYGGSSTVQPNANKLYMYFYVGRKRV